MRRLVKHLATDDRRVLRRAHFWAFFLFPNNSTFFLLDAYHSNRTIRSRGGSRIFAAPLLCVFVIIRARPLDSVAPCALKRGSARTTIRGGGGQC